MSANLSSCESDFVARVAAMEYNLDTYDSDVPNPILAARRIVNAASALAQLDEHPSKSPLRQQVTLEAPKLKRNYGSLDLSRMSSSYSSSSASSLSTPISATFPMDRAWNQDEDIIERDEDDFTGQDSPVLEFSTRARFTEQLELGVVFGPGLVPEFMPADEAEAYLNFMDVLEDCDSLGHFADTSAVEVEVEQWQPEHRLVSPCPTRCQPITPNLFTIASPRVTQRAWALDQVAPRTIGSGSFDTFQWIPTIALIALIANLVVRSVF
ncbi:unnamed protein product [Rhizoctonia solani]|uniref:Uncharacterized protein n=1 Tax=Rhizoctonia solani TaxID=456999 RepID=A0A8H3E735_9AGAM|nr:unnamed protein product [Rhizoctonia solani]